MSHILISGGTGLIGTALTQQLVAKDHTVTILSRSPNKRAEKPGVSYSYWDVEKGVIDMEVIKKTDYLVHLAGAGIADKRWTTKRKQEIKDSRVLPTKLLASVFLQQGDRLKAAVCASAIGWYGADPAIPNHRPFEEQDPAYADFLGNTCLAWEQAADAFILPGKRVVKLRTGIVLSSKGGALKEFLKPVKWGIAPIMGNGRQVISWIHMEDLVRLYIRAIEDYSMQGIYNAVAPLPVTNKELMVQLARKVKGKFFVPIHVPSFLLKMMLGEMSIELLKSTTVSCDKLHREGFSFQYPSLESALREIGNDE